MPAGQPRRSLQGEVGGLSQGGSDSPGVPAGGQGGAGGLSQGGSGQTRTLEDGQGGAGRARSLHLGRACRERRFSGAGRPRSLSLGGAWQGKELRRRRQGKELGWRPVRQGAWTALGLPPGRQ